MNDTSDFNDPAFTGRVRAWADERRREDRAPTRLVDSIMDEVVATPRRRLFTSFGWQGLTGYAALTVVVTVGVTLGILFAQTIGPSVGRTPAPPSIAPSVSPSPTISPGLESTPAPLSKLPDVGLGVAAIGAAGDSIWAVDRSNRLSELDPASGSIVRSVDLPRSVAALLVTADSVWAASTEGALMRIRRSDLDVAEAPGAIGGALTDAGDAIWLGATDEVKRIDPATLAVTLRVPAPGRGAELGIAAVGRDLWVATRTEILRLNGTDGTVTGRLAGDATRIVVLDGTVYANRGSELLRIDPVMVGITEYIPGIPGGGSLAVSPGQIWVAGPRGGAVGKVVGVAATTSTLAFDGAVPRSVLAVTVSSDTIWVATDEADAIYRFALP
jgi:hypothetical protein